MEGGILGTKINIYKGVEAEQDKRLNERINNFRNNIVDPIDTKKKRNDAQDSLRKKQREQIFQKKRNYEINDIGREFTKGYAPIYQSMQFKLEDLPKLVEHIYLEDPELSFHGVFGIRKLLSNESIFPVQDVIDANIVTRLLTFITDNTKPSHQFEAAWCLTNLATGTSDQTECLTEKGAIDKFIQVIGSAPENVKDQAIWAIGNIAGENIKLRDQVIEAGAIPTISAQLLHFKQPIMIRNATWALCNLARGRPTPKFNNFHDCIDIITDLIRCQEDETILSDTCWTLSYITDGNQKHLSEIFETNILPTLAILLGSHIISVKVPALRIIGNLTTGTELETQKVIDAGVLPGIHDLLFDHNLAVRKESCWTISNIAAGTPTHIQMLIDTLIIDRIIELAVHDALEVKKEALWAISNCISCADTYQITVLLKMNVLEPLICILKPKMDARTLELALEAIQLLLQVGQTHMKTENGENPIGIRIDELGGIDNLEALQKHMNIFIYNKVVGILENYFGLEEEELPLPQNELSIFNF